MNIINSKDVQNISTLGDNFLELDLEMCNLTKVLLQILYYQEYGIRKFILNYNSNNVNLPVSKVLKKLNINKMYKLVSHYDIIIGFKGFPRCIFETDILRPGLRWYFEGKLFFLGNEYNCGSGGEKIEACDKCMFNAKCLGVCKEYIEQYGKSEFLPLVSNADLAPLYQEEFDKFESPELKKIAFKILDDFKTDKLYMRKKLVFVKSYPNNLEDSSKERFVYYVYNREDDFEKTFSLIEEIFQEPEFLAHIKKYALISNQLVISFGIMGDGSLRKSLYFNINDLTQEDVNDLMCNSPFEIKYNNLWGMGVDFKGGKPTSTKLYYDYENIKADEIKKFISEVKLENKRTTLKFLNSLIKPLNQVLLDYKYKDNKLYSRRIDISLQYNKFRLNQFAILFNINMSEFLDKELLTLSFELLDNVEKPEKINFYYALKLPEPIDEENGEYRYSGLH